jgi:hypothetical protein
MDVTAQTGLGRQSGGMTMVRCVLIISSDCPLNQMVSRDGDETHLTTMTMEFDLLLFLASHPGQVFTLEELMLRVWGLYHTRGLQYRHRAHPTAAGEGRGLPGEARVHQDGMGGAGTNSRRKSEV